MAYRILQRTAAVVQRCGAPLRNAAAPKARGMSTATGGSEGIPPVYFAALAAVGAAAAFQHFTKPEDPWVQKPKADTTSASKAPQPEPEPEPEPEPVPPPPALEAVYVLIGGGTASFFAAQGIRSKDRTAKILIVSAEDDAPYMRPPLSKELWFRDTVPAPDDLGFKDWGGRDRNLFFMPQNEYMKPEDLPASEEGGIAFLGGRKVVKLDVEGKKLIMDNNQEVTFEKCLIATGGTPKTISVLDNVKDQVTAFRGVDDFRKLNALAKSGKEIAVIGGGFLGSELSIALAGEAKKTGKKVYQIYPEEGNMRKVLPEYLSNWTTAKVKDEGVSVINKERVTNVTKKGKRVSLILQSGAEVEADHVVVAIGIEPNVELAKSARLEIDSNKGGILVNAELEARSDIWVAGDVCSFYDVTLGRRREEHHDMAVVSGRLAGENMTGARKPFSHQSMFWSDLGPNVGYEAIGIVDSNLPTVGVWAKATASDTPQAATEQGGNIRSGAETTEDSPADSPEPSAPVQAAGPADDFGKGVVFYMREKRVVGLVLWNVFNKIPIARKVIREGKEYDDVGELAKLFKIHESH